MLQLNHIQNNKENVLTRLAIKHFDGTKIIDDIIAHDTDRKKTQTELDNTLAILNAVSKEIGQLMAQKKSEEAEVKKKETASLKEEAKQLEEKKSHIEKVLHDLLVRVPNLPHASVPKGRTPEENVVVREGGDEPKLTADAKPHWELTTQYNLISFELGNKITGAGFPVYMGKGAKLQRALISFFLDKAIAAGFQEIQPPLMVNADSGYATGQLPDKDGQMYFVNEDGYYLIPTAEVPVTNIYRDVLLREEELPVKMCAYSQCFRREAGSYGKDVRGLNRLHQFDKVEIVQLEHPDKSYATLDAMVSHVESLLNALGLKYRILRLCGGDMSFASALTFDFEVYSAAQKKWLEVSSVSNFETFQSNRMKLRFKDKNGKINLAHTLNGSALALPRIVAALLENYQTSEEGIRIPDVLRPYTGFDWIK
ncbi:serine--tRNA ligase [Bacteroidota bacterium]|nr:serine--tRNA ligase [Bacteroidota bacterium]